MPHIDVDADNCLKPILFFRFHNSLTHEWFTFMFLCGSLTGCCDPNCVPRKLFQSEQQKLMRKYGRYCVNNRRSSIIIENNLQVILMIASGTVGMIIVVFLLKMNSNYRNQICLSLPPASSIYPFASQNFYTDLDLQIQTCSQLSKIAALLSLPVPARLPPQSGRPTYQAHPTTHPVINARNLRTAGSLAV